MQRKTNIFLKGYWKLHDCIPWLTMTKQWKNREPIVLHVCPMAMLLTSERTGPEWTQVNDSPVSLKTMSSWEKPFFWYNRRTTISNSTIKEADLPWPFTFLCIGTPHNPVQFMAVFCTATTLKEDNNSTCSWQWTWFKDFLEMCIRV